MPGEEDLRAEFVATVQPPLLSQLVERVFETMTLAGEAGSLLKVDEEMSESLINARREWGKHFERAKDHKGRDLLFSVAEMDRLSSDAQQRLDFSDISNDQFWDEAEERIISALKYYAEQSTNGHSIKRGLFREDAAQGFAFIDVCRKRYDVILMNPPFGESQKSVMKYLAKPSRLRLMISTACFMNERCNGLPLAVKLERLRIARGLGSLAFRESAE